MLISSLSEQSLDVTKQKAFMSCLFWVTEEDKTSRKCWKRLICSNCKVLRSFVKQFLFGSFCRRSYANANNFKIIGWKSQLTTINQFWIESCSIYSLLNNRKLWNFINLLISSVMNTKNEMRLLDARSSRWQAIVWR